MEIPSQLKKLYRHWNRHTVENPQHTHARVFLADTRLYTNIATFIRERMNIWKKKTAGAKPPYTNDPVLSTYRFCNIFRELDRQTIEFHTLLNPLRGDFPLWLLNMFYFRMVARTETVQKTGLLSFSKRKNESLYKKLVRSPRPRFGTPYVFPVSVILKSETPTRELFIARHLPHIMPRVAEEILSWNNMSVYDGVQRILPLFGYNLKFLWTEVLIDVAYQFPDRINLFGRFPIGPGALSTLSRLSPGKDPSLLVQDLAKSDVNTGVTYRRKPLCLSAENWEGVACEFRKYTNLKAGRGRKRIFSEQ